MEIVFEKFNYTLGEDNCVKVCIIMGIIFFITSWISFKYNLWNINKINNEYQELIKMIKKSIKWN